MSGSGKRITGATGDWHGRLAAGSCFVVFRALGTGNSCAMVLETRELLPGALAWARGELADSRLEAKLVSSAAEVETTKQLLEREGVPLTGVSSRPGGNAEIVFCPGSGRLRVAWSEAKPEERKTRVLIVDDSAPIRKILISIFQKDPRFEVAGVAERPSEVERLILETKPNVLTLDIHLPEMDGVTLLRRLYPKYGIPAVMITSVSAEEGPLVLDALAHGAVDYIQKPSLAGLDEFRDSILERVREASAVRKRSPSAAARGGTATSRDLGALDSRCLVAIGASTGGTEALREILTRMPAQIPPIVVVQHIPAVFSASLARRLNDLCPFGVREAGDGSMLLPNQVLIAPGGKQLRVERSPQGLRAVVFDGEPVNRHRPAVDVLFESVAKEAGRRAIGVILTGMGSDGARGLLAMRQAGARTVAQDEQSSVVFGMPREAIRLGGVQEIRSLEEIPGLLVDWVWERKSA